MVKPEADKGVNFIVKKGNQDKVEHSLVIEEPLRAPIKKGQKIGSATLTIDGQKVAVCDILSKEDVERMNISTMLWKILGKWMCI